MIRWLHISDLHIREQADWNNYKKELVKKCKEIGKIDFVIVTGDFHDFSDKEDFSGSIKFLQNLIAELNLDISQDLFVVPGNHDGITAIQNKDIFIKAAKFEPLSIDDSLEQLLKMFEDYELFVKELIPCYPNKHPATIHARTWHDKITLLHCNTAIGAEAKKKDNQILDIKGLSALKVNECYPAFLLAHNSFFDLNLVIQSRVKDFVRSNNVRAYLCGDKHIESVDQISYEDNQNKQIPCVISYKSAPDVADEYSRFGIVIGEWEKKEAILKGWEWKSGQGFIVDGTIFEKKIDMGMAERTLSTDVTVSDVYQLPEQFTNWKLIDKELEKQTPKNIVKSMKDFLEGYPCTWPLAFSDLPVRRQQQNDIVSDVKEGGIFALTGAGAEGKSTLLMQVCVQLYREGYTVLYHIPRKNYLLPDNIPENTIIVVDDPDDSDFLELINFAQNGGLTVLFSVRLNEWNLFCRRNNVSADIKRVITKIEIRNITQKSEAEAFANRVSEYCKIEMNHDKLVGVFLNNADESGFLYAAMLLALHEKEKLEEVAKDIIDKIRKKDEKSLFLLGYAVLFEHVGIEFDDRQYEYFLNLLKIKPRDAKDSLDLELRHSGNRRETRHPQISDLFYMNIFGDDGEFNTIQSDGMRYNVIDRLLIIHNAVRYNNSKKALAVEDLVSATQLINEASELEDILQRLIEELRKDVFALQNICSKLKDDRLRDKFGRKCYEAGISVPSIMSMWAKASKNVNGLGDYMEENSTLWIYHEACINQKVPAPEAWLGWAELEEETNGAGDYTKENSALWIYREACIFLKEKASGVWWGWAKLEKKTHGVGDYLKENSTLWIYHQACIEQKVMAPELWQGWGEIERKIRGAGDYNKENSALWIFREACINQKLIGPVWHSWAELEKETHGKGDYTKENSALWIYREACISQKLTGSDVWYYWAELEKEAHGKGDYTKENSALWIYHEACINQKVAGGTAWLGWVKLENGTHGVGGYKKENSTLWIYHEACISQKIKEQSMWLNWVKFVEKYEISEEKWSLEVIHKKALKTTNWEATVVRSYAHYFLKRGFFKESRSLLRKVYKQGSKIIPSELFLIEAISGNYDRANEYSIPRLINELERNINYMSNQYTLYLYYCLQNDEAKASQYHAMLDWSNDIVKIHDKVNKEFWETCQNAYKNIALNEA